MTTTKPFLPGPHIHHSPTLQRDLPINPDAMDWPLPNQMLTIHPASTAASSPPASAPPARPSPSPQNQGLPNGKVSSPFAEKQSDSSAAAQTSNAQSTVSSKDPKAAAQAASDMRNVVRRKLTGYVGFANLPNQWHRKSVRKGFNFNVMVVGAYSTWPFPNAQQTNVMQASLASGNPPSLTPFSTPRCTLQKNARGQALTSFPRLFPSSPSVQTLKRTASVSA